MIEQVIRQRQPPLNDRYIRPIRSPLQPFAVRAGAERVFVDVDDARTIGWRPAHPRRSGQVVRVIAALAGISKATLRRIERGERSPNLNEIVAEVSRAGVGEDWPAT